MSRDVRIALTTAALVAAALSCAVPAAAAPTAGAQATVSAPATAAVRARSSRSTATVRAKKAKPAVDRYDMDFTLPTAGKSGCLVCHGDRSLVRLNAGRLVSYWIDEAVMQASAHSTIQCTGCHLDFAYSAPHRTDGDWRRTAKLACKNCHKDAFQAFGQGVHSLTADATADIVLRDRGKPLCGDCHGSHEIARLKNNPVGKASLHAQGQRICGRCHADYWKSYADYYHGSAYRRGADDAPACWDCHGWHDILPTDDRRSRLNETGIALTCGECHPNVNDEYLTYSTIIHRKGEALARNPVYSFIRAAGHRIGGIFGAVRSWIT